MAQILLQNQVDAWFQVNSSGWKPSTKNAYHDVLCANVLPRIGERPIKGLIKRDFDLLRESMVQRGLSSSYINMTFSVLNGVMEDALANGIIKSNPMNDVKRVSLKVRERVPFTRQEIEQVLLEVQPLHYRPLYVALAWCAARPNEMLGLKWSDIDFEARKINIKRGRYKGKEGLPKSAKAVRTIILPPQLADILSDWPRTSEYVFCEKDGSPINDRQVQRVWERACAAAGLRHEPPYSLRHGMATWMMEQGMSLPFVSAVLGHSNTRITAERYIKYTPQESDNRKLEQLMRGS